MILLLCTQKAEDEAEQTELFQFHLPFEALQVSLSFVFLALSVPLALRGSPGLFFFIFFFF